MADRLQELLQQRALIREHLEWLDAEIAASSGHAGNIPAPATAAPSLQIARPAAIPIAATPIASPHVPDETEALIAKLAAEENGAAVPTKKGCWILFSAALGVCVVIVCILVHYFYRG